MAANKSKSAPFINEYGIDFREEIRIGLYWRDLIGDEVYLRFDQDDMVRWYLQLELAGPIDIRAMVNERMGNHPLKYLQGLDRPPHPPLWIVEAWLDTHERRVRTLPYFGGAVALVGLLAMLGTLASGFAYLKPDNPLIMNPPPGMTPQPPQNLTLPNFNISPPAAPAVPLPTGPKNIGISGAGAGGMPGTSPTSGGSPP